MNFRADNDLLANVDEGLRNSLTDALCVARVIAIGIACAAILLTLGALIGVALFGNP